MARPAGVPGGSADEAVITSQLGRSPRGPYDVVVRCPEGLPMVIETAPVLEDGTPFPTRFWLTCPAVRRAAARVESAAGWAAEREGPYGNCLHREVAAVLAGAEERPTPAARGVIDSWVCSCLERCREAATSSGTPGPPRDPAA